MRNAAVFYGFLFLVSPCIFVLPLKAQQNPLEQYILALHEKVENENRLTGSFNPAQAHSLPLGIGTVVPAHKCILTVFLRNSSVFSALI